MKALLPTAFSAALALSALTGAALAERSTDLRATDTYFGQYMESSSAKRLNTARESDSYALRGADVPFSKKIFSSGHSNYNERRLEGTGGARN